MIKILFIIIIIWGATNRGESNDLVLYDVFNFYIETSGSNGTLQVYPAAVINGLALVTSTGGQGQQLKYCFKHSRVCAEVLGEMLVSKNDTGYVKVALFPNLFELLKDTLTNLTNCEALSVLHKPIKVTVKGNDVECTSCKHIDKVVCDKKFVGILIHGKTLLRYSEMIKYVEKHIGNDANASAWEKVPNNDNLQVVSSVGEDFILLNTIVNSFYYLSMSLLFFRIIYI